MEAKLAKAREEFETTYKVAEWHKLDRWSNRFVLEALRFNVKNFILTESQHDDLHINPETGKQWEYSSWYPIDAYRFLPTKISSWLSSVTDLDELLAIYKVFSFEFVQTVLTGISQNGHQS